MVLQMIWIHFGKYLISDLFLGFITLHLKSMLEIQPFIQPEEIARAYPYDFLTPFGFL